MKLSLRTVMAQAVEAYPNEPRPSWVLNWPGQVVLAASIIHWTSQVTQVSTRKFNAKSTQDVCLSLQQVYTYVLSSRNKVSQGAFRNILFRNIPQRFDLGALLESDF